MSSFLTPLKEQPLAQHQLTKTTAPQRQGDWVCLQCHNLNFSFRKKCNRCKVQTRVDNQRLAAYYQYNQLYYNSQKQNFPSLTDSRPIFSPSPSSITPLSPQMTPTKAYNRQQLPSVSPLVKKYNCKEGNSTQQTKRGGLFENESAWANIDINYFEEDTPEKEIERNGQDQEEQIERIVQRIIL